MLRWACHARPPMAGSPSPISATPEPALARLAEPQNRCLVPFTSFCEYEDTKPRKTPDRFALDESRPLAFFARGFGRPGAACAGTKANPVEGLHELFGFFLDHRGERGGWGVHPEAMPVILTSPDECETDAGPAPPRPFGCNGRCPTAPDAIVARGPREDVPQPAALAVRRGGGVPQQAVRRGVFSTSSPKSGRSRVPSTLPRKAATSHPSHAGCPRRCRRSTRRYRTHRPAARRSPGAVRRAWRPAPTSAARARSARSAGQRGGQERADDDAEIHHGGDVVEHGAVQFRLPGRARPIGPGRHVGDADAAPRSWSPRARRPR